jgi:hypothetical protein
MFLRLDKIKIQYQPHNRAITLSPTFHLLTPGPTASMTPAASRPNISLAPGGGGYKPRR